MSGHDSEGTRDRFDIGTGGTVTPTSGSENGTGEKDPVMGGQSSEKGAATATRQRDEGVSGQGAEADELSGSEPEAPGYGRPV